MAIVNLSQVYVPDPPPKPRAQDRPLDEEEIVAEEKAEKFSIKNWKRIPPVIGTVGFFLRNIPGRNEAVIEQLKNLADAPGVGSRYSKLKELIIIWNNADDFSRKRVDIFDILCAKLNIRRRLFWGWFNEALFDFTEEQVKMLLIIHKGDFVENLVHMSKHARNQQDRRLLSEAMHITETQPVVKIEDNSINQTTHNTVNMLPSFVKSIRRHEPIAPGLVGRTKKERLLTEGKQDYIDTEIVETKEAKPRIFVTLNKSKENENAGNPT